MGNLSLLSHGPFLFYSVIFRFVLRQDDEHLVVHLGGRSQDLRSISGVISRGGRSTGFPSLSYPQFLGNLDPVPLNSFSYS